MKLMGSVYIIAAAAILIGIAASEARATLATERVASALRYPIYATAPTGDSRLFIIEQQGRILIFKNGAVLSTPFLDIRSLIPTVSGNDERGLLGLAFHPNFATNGYFYVDYIDLSNNTVIARYHVSSNPDIADPNSAATIMYIVQAPYPNHKGGTLLFGPNDGYLYIGMGDGGGAGDPGNRAQDTGVLLGKILRIDVDHGFPYTIPPNNPFAGPGLPLDEIWDLGLRNPYRWSFDRATGDMFIADVGQSSWEEIDFEPARGPGGFNYGWRLMEGDHCYDPPQNCYNSSLTLPIYEYDHNGGRCAITGGAVYRGNAIPSLQGTYFFADFCSAQIWSFRYDGSTISEFTERTAELAPGGGLVISSIAAFGEDSQGEMYIVDRGSGTDGEVYRIKLNPSDVPGAGGASPIALAPGVPNPFTRSTQLALVLDHASRIDAEVLDASGRIVRSLASGEFAAGRHLLVWDGMSDGGRRAASGVYFVRARWNGGGTNVERIQLVR